jgi:hypothetical protein
MGLDNAATARVKQIRFVINWESLAAPCDIAPLTVMMRWDRADAGFAIEHGIVVEPREPPGLGGSLLVDEDV